MCSHLSGEFEEHDPIFSL